MNPTSGDKMNKSLIFFFLLFINPLGQLAIDIYLPSLPAMVTALHSTQTAMQYSLTIYMLGMSISTMLYGPLSDRFGRRTILLIGFFVFFISTIGCVFSQTQDMLLLFRLLQGMGVGGTATVAFAIMVDVFGNSKELPRVTSFVTIVYALTPIIAPVFGGYIQHYFGWRANFICMGIYAGILFFALWMYLPETNKSLNKDATNIVAIIKSSKDMIMNRFYISFVLCLTASYAVMISFNIMGPFLLQTTMHLTPIQYGNAALLIGFAYVIGTVLNTFLIKHFDPRKILCSGFIIVILSAIGMLLVTEFVAFNIWTVLASIFIAIAGTGVIFPNGMSAALTIFPEKAGLASALIACLALLGCTIISSVISLLTVQDAAPMAYVFLALGLSGLIIYSFLLPSAIKDQQTQSGDKPIG